ncbi:zinc-binding dehydrogenase, partial [Streptomyces oceani]
AALPFAWRGVRLHASGARELRVRLTPSGDRVALSVADGTGTPVASVESLVLRPFSAGQLSAAPADALFEVEWIVAPGSASDEATRTPDGALPETHRDLSTVPEPAPEDVLVTLEPGEATGPAAVREATVRALTLVRRWLEDERFDASRLVLLTRGAMVTSPGDGAPDPALAAVWGLVRTAETENPGRFALIDTDATDASHAALAEAVRNGERESALRRGQLRLPRLARPTPAPLVPPEGASWRVDVTGSRSLDALAVVESAEAVRELGAGEVRVAVRAAGVNFHDVVVGLGLVDGESVLGSEGAGVVVDTGPEVADLRVGDRVTGLFPGAFAPMVVAEARALVRMPEEWSFVAAAGVPVAFMTAYYGLADLAGLRRGESVLVHSAAGGVGMAAVQLAREWGVEVFATASPSKWDQVVAGGVRRERVFSSRTTDFAAGVLAATGGRGVDVVLNSLAGEFVDASLDVLACGGRFVEMGKTDIRDGERVRAAYPDVSYRAFDLAEAGPARLGEMLRDVVRLLESGVLRHPPVSVWDVRRVPEALRFMSQARHVGKVVLTMPVV